MTSKKETTQPPADAPDTDGDKVVDTTHDLTDHPALESGTIKNVGDTVRDRDPSEPSFRRPELEPAAEGEQSTAKRETTMSDPDKKTARSSKKSGGVGPES